MSTFQQATGMLKVLTRWRRCRHEHVRCVHGDEILARKWRRVVCVACGKALKGPLPLVCTVSHRPHI